MSKWNVGDKVQHKDSKQKGWVIEAYPTAFCQISTNSGTTFTVRDKELESTGGV